MKGKKIVLVLKCEKREVILNLSDEETMFLYKNIVTEEPSEIISFIKNYISKLYREMGYDLNDIIESCDIKFM